MSSALPELSAAGEPAESIGIDVSTWRARVAWISAALGTLLVGVGAWLLVPRDRGSGAAELPALRICLVDVSDSAVQRRRQWDGWIRETLATESRDADRAGEEVCVIVYGAEVRRVFGPAAATTFGDAEARNPSWMGLRLPTRSFQEQERGPASRLTGALRAAAELARSPGRGRCRVVVIGDGTYTGHDPRPVLRDLGDLGSTLERRDLPAPDIGEIVLSSLSLPREVEAGAPIAAEFELFYAPGDGPPEAELALTVRHSFSARNASRTLLSPVPAGVSVDEDGYLRWRVRTEVGRAEPGVNRVRISGRSSRSDRSSFVRAGGSEGFVHVRGRLRVGLVSDGVACILQYSPDPSIRGPGFDAEPMWPDQLPQRLADLDAVVTCDIPPDRLPHELLTDFVRRGGGWFAFLAEECLRSFGTDDVRALELLPLRPREDDRPPRDVVFVVDRSGSMAGERSQNVTRALFAVLGLVPARDGIELMWFSDHLSEAVRMPDSADPSRRRAPYTAQREFADRVLAARGAGGPTALVRSLGELAAAREKSGRESIVFLLSDGHDTIDPDPVAACPAIVQRLAAARARLVVVAAGEDADRALLARLVTPGEALEDAGSLAEPDAAARLETIFRRELGNERVQRGDALTVLPAPALSDPSSAPTLAREIVAAMPREIPPIQAFVRTETTPDAEALWVSEKGEPLLALRRVGVGLTAACASAPAQGWADAWRERGDLFAPLLRILARGKPQRSPRVHVEGSELVVEDLPDGTPALLEACVFGADERADDPPRARIPLSAPTEGDPRHVRRGTIGDDAINAAWDEFESGDGIREHRTARAPWIELRAVDDDDWTPLALPIVPPSEVEFLLPRPRVPSEPFLHPPDAASPLPRARETPTPHPAAQGVLLSGLLLLSAAGLAGFFARRAA